MANRRAALLSSAIRDWLTVLVSGDQWLLEGFTGTRGGLGAYFCAMIGRYLNGTNVFLPGSYYVSAT